MNEMSKEALQDRMFALDEAIDRAVAARIALRELGEGWEGEMLLLRDMTDALDRDRERCLKDALKLDVYSNRTLR